MIISGDWCWHTWAVSFLSSADSILSSNSFLSFGWSLLNVVLSTGPAYKGFMKPVCPIVKNLITIQPSGFLVPLAVQEIQHMSTALHSEWEQGSLLKKCYSLLLGFIPLPCQLLSRPLKLHRGKADRLCAGIHTLQSGRTVQTDISGNSSRLVSAAQKTYWEPDLCPRCIPIMQVFPVQDDH